MAQRLKYYRDMSGGVTAVIPEPTFTAVEKHARKPVTRQILPGITYREKPEARQHGGENAVREEHLRKEHLHKENLGGEGLRNNNLQSEGLQKNHLHREPPQQESAPSGLAALFGGEKNSLFGIELTADNCLIIALILILMKEKADMKLIIALLFLLL